MKDIDCGPHPVTLQAGSMRASVNISIINDEDSECDEIFTAQIIIGKGNSSREGFRLGQNPSISIIVKDIEGDMGLSHHFLHYVTHSILRRLPYIVFA